MNFTDGAIRTPTLDTQVSLTPDSKRDFATIRHGSTNAATVRSATVPIRPAGKPISRTDIRDFSSLEVTRVCWRNVDVGDGLQGQTVASSPGLQLRQRSTSWIKRTRCGTFITVACYTSRNDAFVL